MLCAGLPACAAKPAGDGAKHDFQKRILAIVDGAIRAAEAKILCQVGEHEAMMSAVSKRLQEMKGVKDVAAEKFNAQDEVVKARTVALQEKESAKKAVKCVLDKAEACMQVCDKAIGTTTMEREYIGLAQKAMREADSADMLGLASAILALPTVLHHLLLPPDVSAECGFISQPAGTRDGSRRNSCGPTPESLSQLLSAPGGVQRLSAFLADRVVTLEGTIAAHARERVASFVDVQTASAALSLAEERRQHRETALSEAQAAHAEADVGLRKVADEARALAAESGQAFRALTAAKERLARLRGGPLALLRGLALEDARAAERAARAAREAVRRRRCSWLPRTLAALRGKPSNEANSLRAAVSALPTPGRSGAPCSEAPCA